MQYAQSEETANGGGYHTRIIEGEAGRRRRAADHDSRLRSRRQFPPAVFQQRIASGA